MNIDLIVKHLTVLQQNMLIAALPNGQLPRKANPKSVSGLRRIDLVIDDHLTSLGLQARERLPEHVVPDQIFDVEQRAPGMSLSTTAPQFPTDEDR